MDDLNIEEAIQLQVLLKAEQIGIQVTDKNLPQLTKMAKAVGAPYKMWEFKRIYGIIRAVNKGAVE